MELGKNFKYFNMCPKTHPEAIASLKPSTFHDANYHILTWQLEGTKLKKLGTKTGLEAQAWELWDTGSIWVSKIVSPF